jgi:hypothetical protein
MQTQILRRVCDNPRCQKMVDLPVGHMRPTDEAELGSWIVLTKEHILVSGDQPQAIAKMGCCGTCAVEIVRNGQLDLPKKVGAN